MHADLKDFIVTKIELPMLVFSQQTNTADMLDLAVEYIKDLQKQFKVIE